MNVRSEGGQEGERKGSRGGQVGGEGWRGSVHPGGGHNNTDTGIITSLHTGDHEPLSGCVSQ